MDSETTPGPHTCCETDCTRPAEYGFTQCERCMRATEIGMELEAHAAWFSDRDTGRLHRKVIDHPERLERVMGLQRELETLR